MAQIERVFTTVNGQRYMACIGNGVLFYARCETHGNYVGWCTGSLVSMPLMGADDALHPLSENISLVQAYIKLYLSMPDTPDD